MRRLFQWVNTTKPRARYAVAIVASIFLPYIGNNHLWPFGSAVCLTLVLHYIRDDRHRLTGEGAARRQRGMICARCGYDLRATTDRCPECGTVPTAENPA